MSITAPNPLTKLYGTNSQTAFPASKERAVSSATQEIISARKQGEDMSLVFERILGQLASERKVAAYESGTENPAKFGRKREYATSNISYTVLCDGNYENCRKDLMTKMQSLLVTHIPIKGPVTNKKIVDSSSFKDRRTSFELFIYDSKDLQKLEWNKETHSKLNEAMKLLDLSIDLTRLAEEHFPQNEEDINLCTKFHENQKTIKRSYPDFYIHDNMSFALRGINTSFPSPQPVYRHDGKISHFMGDAKYLKSLYIVGKVRCEINSKAYCLSQFITWTYQNYVTDPIERMKDLPIMILHQDLYLVEDTIKEIGTIFKKAVEWDNSSHTLQELMEDVGTIRYLLVQSMPFIRGSAAISEWLEEAIYKSHALSIERSPEKPADLEAFSSPTLDVFMNERYRDTIRVSQES